MKSTQAILLLGLAALLTFQVKRSSATALQSEGDLQLLSDEELFAGTDNIETLVKEGLEKLREFVHKEVEKIKANPVAKEVAERLAARITTLREAVKKIADNLPNTELGALAKKLVAEFEAAIKKVREGIKGKKPQGDEDDVAAAGPLVGKAKQRLITIRDAANKVADELGDDTELGKHARNVAKLADSLLAKMKG